jgi:hypothetical protein
MSGVTDGNALVALQIRSALLSALDLSTPIDTLSILKQVAFGNGTGSVQLSQHWHDTRTLGPSATENLDLAGALVNGFGATVTFTKVKILYIAAAAGNTNDVQVSRGASNGFVLFLATSDAIVLHPGDFTLYCAATGAGTTVTAGTGDILTVTNGAAGTSVTYDIFIGGND